ncbi:MAG: glycosyltransferase [Promethearchaeota archaeon]
MKITLFSAQYLRPLINYLENNNHNVLLNHFSTDVDVVICESVSHMYKVLKVWKLIKKNNIKVVNIILDIPPHHLTNQYKYNKPWWYGKQLLYHLIYYHIHNNNQIKKIFDIFKKFIYKKREANNQKKGIGKNNKSNSLSLYSKINLNPYNKITYYKNYRNFLKKSDLNLSISKFTQICLKTYLNIDSKVWHLCVDSDLLSSIPKDLKIKYDAINVSRITPHKHQKIFVEAAKKLGLKIVVIGRHHDKNLKLNCDHYPLSHKEALKAIAQSRIYVDPSSFEGFGLTPVEALYLDKPVIASDTYVHREILRDYPLYFKTGDVNDLVNKMKLVRDGDFSKPKNTVDYIKNEYSIENTGVNFLNYLESCFENNKRKNK